MRYKVYDEEDKKERTLEECVTPLEVGSVRRVQVKKGDTREVHHLVWLHQYWGHVHLHNVEIINERMI